MSAVAEAPSRGDLITRVGAQHSLYRFIRKAWHAVEAAPYRDGWHIGAMAEHLQAVAEGQIKRLLIIVPPQTSKSILCGTFWPAWEWTFQPHKRWLFASNSEDLARAESIRCRKLIESDWYRNTFGIPWELAADKNTVGHYANTTGGERIAKGFGANFTGLKANRVVVDDANDAEKVHSEAERRRVNRKFDNAISDRHLDLNNDPTVIVGQRTHYNDLIGHVMSQGGWHVLHLREQFIPERRTSWAVPVRIRGKLYRTDPRHERNELLRPKDFGPARVRERRQSNLMSYQAKHQGDPRSAEGYRFKDVWFADRRWRYAADGVHIELQSNGESFLVHPFGALNLRERFGIVDPNASKSVTADYTVLSTFLITSRYDLVWFGCRRQRAEIPEQPAVLEEEYRRMQLQWVGVEAVFGNRGLLQHAQKSKMNARSLNPGGRDKLAHATPAMILCEAKRVWLPSPEAAMMSGFPLASVMDELTSFTGDPEQDEHDDVIDTLSYAVDYFSGEDNATGGGGAPFGIGPTRGGFQPPAPPQIGRRANAENVGPTAPAGVPNTYPRRGGLI